MVARVGDTGFRDRVGEQEFRRPPAIAGAALHAFEHAAHTVRVEPRAYEGCHPDTVCFLLATAAVSQLAVQ